MPIELDDTIISLDGARKLHLYLMVWLFCMFMLIYLDKCNRIKDKPPIVLANDLIQRVAYPAFSKQLRR